MRTIYICEDTVTGIFSAIYDAWKAGEDAGRCGIGLRGQMEQELFCSYTEVEESEKKAEAVERMILKHLGEKLTGIFIMPCFLMMPGKELLFWERCWKPEEFRTVPELWSICLILWWRRCLSLAEM